MARGDVGGARRHRAAADRGAARPGGPVAAAGPAPVRIGRGSWIGDHATVLRGSTIGEFCMIGANSVVRGDIPDRSVAVGSPARVVGRTDAPV